MNLNRPLQIQRQRQNQKQLRPPKKSRRPLQVQRQRQIQGQLRPPKKKQAAATNSKTTSNSKTTAPRYGLPLLGWKYSGAVAAGRHAVPLRMRGAAASATRRDYLVQRRSPARRIVTPQDRLDWIAVGVNE